jgi:hypothetical protein
MTTTWYQLEPSLPSGVRVRDVWLTAHDFQISRHASVERSCQDGWQLTLARLVHEAMVETVQALRDKVAAWTSEHVSVLVRNPLTVLAADSPQRRASVPCGVCLGCTDLEVCEDPSYVLDAEGKPVMLPSSTGYFVFVTAAVVATTAPATHPDAEVVAVDEEPWWMRVPDLDEEAVLRLPWRNSVDRYRLVDALMPVRPG